MSAKYDLYPNPDDKTILHPRLVSYKTVGTAELCEIISQKTSFSQGDVRGILTELGKQIKQYLAEGYQVELEEMGFFHVSLQSRPVKDKSEIRSPSVSFKNINFRAGKEAKRLMKGMTLERSPKNEPPVHPAEERKILLLDYLKKNPCITRSDYMQLTGTNRYEALRELNEGIKRGELRSYGAGRTVVYCRK